MGSLYKVTEKVRLGYALRIKIKQSTRLLASFNTYFSESLSNNAMSNAQIKCRAKRKTYMLR